DQALAAGPARSLQLSPEVALHRAYACQHAQEAHYAGEACEALCPGDEPGPVRARQAEQFADDRQRELGRVAFAQFCRTSVSKEFDGELISNREDSRLHAENGAATEGFVDDAAQAGMVRLVHGEHADRDRAYPTRHPPAQTSNLAVLAHRERLAVLQ